jgi:hypothetical protein
VVTVNVLLSGRLKLDGYAKGRPADYDGTYPLALDEGSTVRQAMDGMRVPAGRVVMTMLNGHQCADDTLLRSGDRVILIPEDVAALWRALGRQSLGMGVGSDC